MRPRSAAAVAVSLRRRCVHKQVVRAVDARFVRAKDAWAGSPAYVRVTSPSCARNPGAPMLTTLETIAPQVAALRARMTGELVLPRDPAWDEARLAWNLAVDQRPAAVALPETAGDVVAVVQFARESGLRVAPQGTGHNASPIDSLDDTVLLKTEHMRGVEVDPAERVARVEAGAL